MKRWPVSGWAHAGFALMGATLLAPALGVLTFLLLQAIPQPAGHMDSEGWGKFGALLWALMVTAGSWLVGIIALFVMQRRWAARQRARLLNTGVNSGMPAGDA